MRALRLVAVSCVFAAAGCGKSSPPTTPTPTPVTITVSGSTSQTGVNSCSGDTHTFNAAEGEITVRLTATSDPNLALSVQVCGGSSDVLTNCAIRQQRINVSQSLAGARLGGTAQTLKFLPFACVFSNTFDPTPVTYTAAVTYLQ
jgi:hypothetical protein